VTTAESPSRRRISSGRLLRAGFLVLVLALALYFLFKNRDGIASAWHRVSVAPVAGAFALSAAAAASGVPAWRDLLIGLGSRLRFRDAQRVFLMGQLGKYIPGGVWTVLAQATMAKDLNVPRARSATASLMSILLAVVTAAGLGAVCLGIAGRQILGTYGYVLLLVVPLLALLHPDVLVRFGAVISKITRRNLPLERIPARTILTSAGWLVLGQICNGLAFYLLVDSIGGQRSNPLLDIGLFALAAVAGIVVVFAPAGVGPREAILLLGLSAVLSDTGSAALIVLMSRLLLTIVDVALAAGAAGIGWRPRAGGRRAVSETDPADLEGR